MHVWPNSLPMELMASLVRESAEMNDPRAHPMVLATSSGVIPAVRCCFAEGDIRQVESRFSPHNLPSTLPSSTC